MTWEVVLLTITHDAAAAIRQLLTAAGVPEGCALRIQNADIAGRLRILLVSHPQPGDIAHDAGDGARLYVAEEVIGRLQGNTLDARPGVLIHPRGNRRVQFVLGATPKQDRTRQLAGAGVF
ncbi:hypothetical protein [Paractinoplanes atraurantiacus]|uniref:Fe-S cluster assembly iron-binding protein IscA n=1 Tax=Paractinoplanes atraurantiacus TaxID=1036182 RepID=A0A285GQT7_9ACTN|nr:hypothetical protein [Actinoplanes atraurantiacus]SNY25653.1 Fe-S cluster assembly iron-binding protein IscA [Actinoplanes atraurantiacus]